MANRRWTSSEDAILLSCMEDSDRPLTYAEIRMRIPSRTEAAIQDHYRVIRTRELDEDEYTALQTSWQRLETQPTLHGMVNSTNALYF